MWKCYCYQVLWFWIHWKLCYFIYIDLLWKINVQKVALEWSGDLKQSRSEAWIITYSHIKHDSINHKILNLKQIYLPKCQVEPKLCYFQGECIIQHCKYRWSDLLLLLALCHTLFKKSVAKKIYYLCLTVCSTITFTCSF